VRTSCERNIDFIDGDRDFGAEANESPQTEIVYHPNYGEQFRINDIVIDAPDDLESIRNYLSSGLLSGIGEKKADDLISYFGLSVLDVISENPYRLTEVKGIGEKTARNIHEAYEQQFAE
jgi:exodeoxyribonuclease V alpha subunit